MNDPKISVLVPLYNVELYVYKCITSILNQTMSDIEIIIVNDCSIDESLNVVKKLNLYDSRIKIISHDNNKGLGGARNTGIRAARANILVFVDSDDWVSPKLCETVYCYFENYDVDVVSYGAYECNDNNIIYAKKYIKHNKFQLLNNLDAFKKCLIDYRFPLQSWSKACKKDIFIDNDISFPENSFQQDVATTPKIVYFSRKIALVPDMLYFYRHRNTSATSTISYRHIDNIENIMSILKKFLIENNLYDKYKNEYYKFYFKHRVFFATAHRILQNSRSDYEAKKYLLYSFNKILNQIDLKDIIDLLNIPSFKSILSFSDSLICDKSIESDVHSKEIKFNDQDISKEVVHGYSANRPCRLPLVFIFDSEYSLPALVCIYSLLKQAKDTTSYSVICILAPDVRATISKDLKKIFRHFNSHQLSIIRISDFIKGVDKLSNHTPITCYSLFLHRILKEYEHVICCDVDTIFLDDISSLSKDNYDNCFISAVKSLPVNTNSFRMSYGISDDKCFNSGFLIITLKLMRNISIESIINAIPYKLLHRIDQDIFNIIAKDSVSYLDLRFNVTSHIESSRIETIYNKAQIIAAKKKPCLRHWNGKKPWDDFNVKDANIWWKHYKEVSDIIDVPKIYPRRDDGRKNILCQLVTVKRLTPQFEHYFFGYYDLLSNDPGSGKFLGCKVLFPDQNPGKNNYLELYVFNENGSFTHIESTLSWNFQQGSMFQFRPNRPIEVIYNIYNNVTDSYQTCICDISTNNKKYFEMPIAAVSSDGNRALSINFSRLYDFRPGYGYNCKLDPFRDQKHPDGDGIWMLDLDSGDFELIISYDHLRAKYLKGTALDEYKLVINHVAFNPSASKILFLLRFIGEEYPWTTYTFVANADGSNIRRIFGPASHYFWKDDDRLLITGFDTYSKTIQHDMTLYTLNVVTGNFAPIDPDLFKGDGHCSFSPDQRYILYDSYPKTNFPYKRLFVYDTVKSVGRNIGFFLSEKRLYGDNNELRCDLHPRWSPDGKSILFDSIHDGFRGIYKIDFSEVKYELNKKFDYLKYEDVVNFYVANSSSCFDNDIDIRILKTIDDLKMLPGGKKIWIYGASRAGESILNALRDYGFRDIEGFLDTYKSGIFLDYQVTKIINGDAIHIEDSVLLISSQFAVEITRGLQCGESCHVYNAYPLIEKLLF